MKNCLSIVIVSVGVALSLICATESEAGGYFMTDRDGKVISEDNQAVITIGPLDKTVIFLDRGEREVFELLWDAEARSLVVKGSRVHLKIDSDGTVEKWTRIPEDQQIPLIIEPIVPVGPHK